MISVCRISMVDSRRWFMCSCIVRQGLVPRAGGLLERGPIGGVRLSRPVGPSSWMCVAHRMSPPVQSPNDDRAIARINHRLRLCNERRHTTSDTHATSVPAHRCRFQSGSSEVHDEPPYHCWPDRSAPLAQITSLPDELGRCTLPAWPQRVTCNRRFSFCEAAVVPIDRLRRWLRRRGWLRRDCLLGWLRRDGPISHWLRCRPYGGTCGVHTARRSTAPWSVMLSCKHHASMCNTLPTLERMPILR